MVVGVELLNPNVLNLLRNDLQAAGRQFRDNGRLRKLFEEIRDEVVIPSIETNFRVGGRPKWDPITEATFLWRGGTRGGYVAAGLAGSLTPLDHTGRMRRMASAKARFTIRNNEMTYGNWPATRSWAPIHDFGGFAGGVEIPQRQWAVFQREDIVAIEEITNDWIERNIESKMRRRYR